MRGRGDNGARRDEAMRADDILDEDAARGDEGTKLCERMICTRRTKRLTPPPQDVTQLDFG